MTSNQIRQKYLDFFKNREHAVIEQAKLVLEGDSTTLFTSAGMQPLVPFLKGESAHQLGKRLVDSQPCFRSQDIDEVGDNRHTTFFEMLGNWSLGDYFKKEQIPWLWEFLTVELGLPKEKLYVSVFKGEGSVGKDIESEELWKSLGVEDSHIHFYGAKKNWWALSGTPEQMKEGEIGGPDSEVFYEFTQVEHDPSFGEKCHPNCDCGRFLEIANSVFIQYQKNSSGNLVELPSKNVDFGGGLERLAAAVDDDPDIFNIDLYKPILKRIEEDFERGDLPVSDLRIIADHIKATTFLILNGVIPSNKLHGYVLRRLLRRSAVKLQQLGGGIANMVVLEDAARIVLKIYGLEKDQQLVEKIISEEMKRFGDALVRGMKEIAKIEKIDGKKAFDLYQSYGFPLEITEELFRQKGQEIDHTQFEEEFKKHQELSRSASAGIFKGGLAGHSETEIKYHTATHLLHQALRDVLGPGVFQKGSNITEERLRFDFSFERKLSGEEVREVEERVNQKIREKLVVENKTISLQQAREENAIGLFGDKYAQNVSVYGIGPNYKIDPAATKDTRLRGGYYSFEFCGGPHVKNTEEVGGIKIIKEEAISQGIRRIRAVLN